MNALRCIVIKRWNIAFNAPHCYLIIILIFWSAFERDILFEYLSEQRTIHTCGLLLCEARLWMQKHDQCNAIKFMGCFRLDSEHSCHYLNWLKAPIYTCMLCVYTQLCFYMRRYNVTMINTRYTYMHHKCGALIGIPPLTNPIWWFTICSICLSIL